MNNPADQSDSEQIIAQLIEGRQPDADQLSHLPDAEQQAWLAIHQVQAKFSTMREQAQSTDDIRQNMTWGHLVIGNKIGEGGMGDVYQGFDQTLNRPVAIKFLNNLARKYISQAHFLAEARRLAKIRHPHVVAIYGAQSKDGLTGFWSELLTGQELTGVSLNEYSDDQLYTWFQQLAEALKSIHRSGLIHGDIKPSNVMLEKDRGMVLMDFGAGQDLLGNEPDVVFASQTPLIMAPELHQGMAPAPPADVFALGVLFYFLLANGKHPFNGNTLEELKQQTLKLSVDYTSLRGHPGWHQLIRQMLAKQPADRPQASEIVSTINRLRKAPLKRLKAIARYALMSLLLASTLILTISYLRVQSANNKTALALRETQAFNELMYDFLASASPTSRGKEVLMIDVLNQLIEDTRQNPGIHPVVKAKALSTLAISLNNLGHHETGLSLFDEALELAKGNHILTFTILTRKGRAIYSNDAISNTNKITQLTAISEQVKQLVRHVSDPELLAGYHHIMGQLANSQGDSDQAKQHFSSSLAFWQQLPPERHADTQQGLVQLDLGTLAMDAHDDQTALSHYLSAMNLFERHSQGQTNSNILGTTNNLAILYDRLGDKQAALEAFKDLYRHSLQLYGPEHRNHHIVTLNLISAYNANQLYQDALELIQNTEQTIISQIGKSSMITLYFLANKAATLKGLQQFNAAEKLLLETLDTLIAESGFEHELVYNCLANLAELYQETAQYQHGLQVIGEYLPDPEASLDTAHPVQRELLESLAWLHHHLSPGNPYSLHWLQQVLQAREADESSSTKDTQKTRQRLEEVTRSAELSEQTAPG